MISRKSFGEFNSLAPKGVVNNPTKNRGKQSQNKGKQKIF